MLQAFLGGVRDMWRNEARAGPRFSTLSFPVLPWSTEFAPDVSVHFHQENADFSVSYRQIFNLPARFSDKFPHRAQSLTAIYRQD